jgi:uncharacterized protein (TIGR03503 family)
MRIFSYLTAYFAHCYRLFFMRAWLILFAVLPIVANQVIAQELVLQKSSDFRIIIDISGSMKKNDPKNLRVPAVEMLSKLLPDGSKAGIWTFGEFVNMLVKHRPVDISWKREATAKSSVISSRGQYTNIGEALEKAAYDKSFSKTDQYQTHVLIMTDGMVDIDREPSVNERERNRIINEILPSYQQAGYVIHTISLSDKADKKLMDRLALATGGQSVVAETADELMEVFLQIFNRAVPQEELPLEGNSFLTDSSIEEFTALIFREPSSPETTLFAPDKTAYTKDTVDENISWYRTDKYDLITFKKPLEGEWQVLADLQPQSRITVVSDLSLSVKSIASNLMVNDEVDFSLAFREGNKVVDRAEFLELLDINLTINTIDVIAGTTVISSMSLSEGLVPGNGIYKALIKRFNKVGEYEVIVDVDGKTFKRRSVQRVSVRTPFKIETQTINEGDNTQFYVEVIPQSQNIDFANIEVVAKVKPPTGSSLIKPFELTDNQAWKLSIKPEAEGIYYVTIRITTKNSDGDSNDIVPETLSFTFPVADNLFVDQADMVEVIVLDTQPSAPAVIGAVPPIETLVNAASDVEESAVEKKEVESNMMQWVLYGVIGLVNLIIIGIIFVLYRKFVKPKKEPVIVDEINVEKEPEIAPAMDELPMDEMALDELDELDNNIDLAKDDSIEQALSTSDALTDLPPEALDDDLDDTLADDEDLFDDLESELKDLDMGPAPKAKPKLAEDMTEDDASGEFKTELIDEDPEYSLDDFAPDQSDNDETETDKK